MKVAFAGQGGSGKTTLASLLIRHLAARDLPVVAVDADINQHLAEALGAGRQPPAMAARLGGGKVRRTCSALSWRLLSCSAWLPMPRSAGGCTGAPVSRSPPSPSARAAAPGGEMAAADPGQVSAVPAGVSPHPPRRVPGLVAGHGWPRAGTGPGWVLRRV